VNVPGTSVCEPDLANEIAGGEFLGAQRDYDHGRCDARPPRDSAEQVLGRRIGPLRVLENDKEATAAHGPAAEPIMHRVECEVAFDRRAGAWRWEAVVGAEAEQIAEQRDGVRLRHSALCYGIGKPVEVLARLGRPIEARAAPQFLDDRI
jgi:hypothetical protein